MLSTREDGTPMQELLWQKQVRKPSNVMQNVVIHETTD